MRELLAAHFAAFPAQNRVARLLLEHGLAVRDDGVWCGRIAVSDTAIARAANVDRRVVGATVATIEKDPALQRVFGRLLPTALLTEAAPGLGWGVIEIVPDDAARPGILAAVATAIADAGVSIRQAIVQDPEFSEEPRLYIITESPLPVEILPRIQEATGVRSVVLPHANEAARPAPPRG